MRKLYFRSSLIAILILAITGCSQKGRNQDKDSFTIEFPETENLSWEIIPSDEIIPFPDDVMARDSVIIVLGNLDNSWIHLYDKRTGAPLQSYVGYGEGPEEIICACNAVINQDGEISISDLMTDKIIKLKRDFTTEDVWNVREIAPHLSGAWQLREDKWLIDHFIPKDHILHHNMKIIDFSSPEKIIFSYEIKAEDLNVNPMMLMRDPKGVVSPDGLHFARGIGTGCILQIFDIKDDRIIPKKSEVYFEPEFDEEGNTDPFPVRGFTSLTATDKYIIGSYGGTRSDFEVNKIGIWDWNGNPVKLIQTDGSIFRLALDESEGMLYAVLLQENEERALAKMKISLN